MLGCLGKTVFEGVETVMMPVGSSVGRRQARWEQLLAKAAKCRLDGMI